MHARPAVLALVLALVVAPAAAGCTRTPHPRPTPEPTTMPTRQQAADAVDALIEYDGDVRTAVDTLRTYWLSNGFRPFNETKNPDGTVTGVGVQRVSDDFHARVFYNDAEDLMISASSICVTSASTS